MGLATVLATSCGRWGYASLPEGDAGAGGAPHVADASSETGPAGGGMASARPDASVSDGGTSSNGGTSGNGGTSSSGGADSSAGGPADAAVATDASLPIQPVTDWCLEVPELPAAPVIDGRLERGLDLRAITPLDWNATGSPDTAARYAVAWSAGGLYFFVSLRDPAVTPADALDPVWYGDSVELYVDSDGTYGAPPAYDAVGTRQFVVGAPVASAPTARAAVYSGGSVLVGAWAGSAFGAFPAPDGYVVEAFVTAQDLGLASWTLAARGVVGFDLGINVSSGVGADAGTQGHRLGQYFFHVAPSPTGQPFRDVTALCQPTLVAR